MAALHLTLPHSRLLKQQKSSRRIFQLEESFLPILINIHFNIILHGNTVGALDGLISDSCGRTFFGHMSGVSCDSTSFRSHFVLSSASVLLSSAVDASLRSKRCGNRSMPCSARPGAMLFYQFPTRTDSPKYEYAYAVMSLSLYLIQNKSTSVFG